jgi:hypothetical protein
MVSCADDLKKQNRNDNESIKYFTMLLN